MKKILFVEDDLKILDKYDRWTDWLDIETIYAPDVEHAKVLIDMNTRYGFGGIDLVIIDFSLHDGNGNDVAEYAKNTMPSVPVIGNTGGLPSNLDPKYVDFTTSKITNKPDLVRIIKSYIPRK